MDHTLSQTSAKQLLDYYLLNECILKDKKRGFGARVMGTLEQNHSIRVKEVDVYQRFKGVLAGNPLRPSADVNGTPSTREGKDQNYAGLIALVDIMLPRKQMRYYVGLPANQLDFIATSVGGNITAVEKVPERAQKIAQFAKFVTKMRNNMLINVVNDDVWSYLQTTSEKFNVFDLDLMCHLPDDSSSWANAIHLAARPGVSVAHVTTCIGRGKFDGLTEEKYETRVVRFIGNLISAGFKSLGHSRFSYRDRITPMRCERLVLKKETGESK